jgi:hypothetical protein
VVVVVVLVVVVVQQISAHVKFALHLQTGSLKLSILSQSKYSS